ncbi:PilZ domain-containing protein [Heliobacterium chlorum]|uniref:PilZ domain-containing protein n=1 Tax=Heliobacterium chlorum TaxID=2698 RepID=A0ABR7T109_HELCL|nr:PilZ domain-containing protein [Heliobacterium chlorum]MBC9783625.1 PilZ domain-containing protein [Heliobacterium chlorum]
MFKGVERRKDPRTAFREKPLCACLRMTVKGGKGAQQSNPIDVCVFDISPSGAQFVSHLKFPTIHEFADMTVHFKTRLSGNISNESQIVWRKEQSGFYRYGIRFLHPDEGEKNLLRVQIHNAEVFLQTRDIANLTVNCSFCSKDRCLMRGVDTVGLLKTSVSPSESHFSTA